MNTLQCLGAIGGALGGQQLAMLVLGAKFPDPSWPVAIALIVLGFIGIAWGNARQNRP